MTTYENRIEFCFDRVDADAHNLEKMTATVNLDNDERLIPFDVGGRTLYWDKVDEAFRLRDMLSLRGLQKIILFNYIIKILK